MKVLVIDIGGTTVNMSIALDLQHLKRYKDVALLMMKYGGARLVTDHSSLWHRRFGGLDYGVGEYPHSMRHA